MPDSPAIRTTLRRQVSEMSRADNAKTIAIFGTSEPLKCERPTLATNLRAAPPLSSQFRAVARFTRHPCLTWFEWFGEASAS